MFQSIYIFSGHVCKAILQHSEEIKLRFLLRFSNHGNLCFFLSESKLADRIHVEFWSFIKKFPIFALFKLIGCFIVLRVTCILLFGWPGAAKLLIILKFVCKKLIILTSIRAQYLIDRIVMLNILLIRDIILKKVFDFIECFVLDNNRAVSINFAKSAVTWAYVTGEVSKNFFTLASLL